MKLFKLLISVIMVGTFGVNQVSGIPCNKCDCIEVQNDTDCKLEIRLTCCDGSQTSCLTVDPNSKKLFCASDFGCSSLEFTSDPLEFNVECPTSCYCGGQPHCPSGYSYNSFCGTQTSLDCSNCGKGQFGYMLDCTDTPCQFVITP